MAFESQQGAIHLNGEDPFSQTVDFVSQAPFAPAPSRSKRPCVDETDAYRGTVKRPKIDDIADVAREVRAELAKQRRTKNLLEILEENKHEASAVRHDGSRSIRTPPPDVVDSAEIETHRASQQQVRPDFHETGLVEEAPANCTEQETEEEAAARYGINLKFLNEQLEKIGDVSEKEKPPDELLFYIGDQIRPRRSRYTIPQTGESLISKHEASGRMNGAKDQGIGHFDAGSEASKSPLYTLQVETHARTPYTTSSVSLASHHVDDAAAQGAQEVVEDPLHSSDASDEVISWSSSPEPPTPIIATRRLSDQLPPDSSNPLIAENQPQPHGMSNPVSRRASQPVNMQTEDTEALDTLSEDEELSIDRKKDETGILGDSDSDSELDEAEPHALGEELFMPKDAMDHAKSPPKEPVVTTTSALQVLETPYLRRGDVIVADQASSLSSRLFSSSASHPHTSPQTLVPGTLEASENRAQDVPGSTPVSSLRDSHPHSGRTGVACSEDNKLTQRNLPRDELDGTSSTGREGNTQTQNEPESRDNAALKAHEIEVKQDTGSQNEAGIQNHTESKAHEVGIDEDTPTQNDAELQDITESTAQKIEARRDVSSTSSTGLQTGRKARVGASLDLSSQKLVLEDPATTARRIRREFMRKAASNRSSHENLSSSQKMPSPPITRQDDSSHTSISLQDTGGTSTRPNSGAPEDGPNQDVKVLGRSRQNPITINDETRDDTESENNVKDEALRKEQHVKSVDPCEVPSQKASEPWFAGETPFKEFARNYSRLKVLGGRIRDPDTLDVSNHTFDVLGWEL